MSAGESALSLVLSGLLLRQYDQLDLGAATLDQQWTIAHLLSLPLPQLLERVCAEVYKWC